MGTEANGSGEEGFAGSTQGLEELVWLARILRDHGLVQSEPNFSPEGAGTRIAAPLCKALVYEPRSLATSKSGRLVAVGTKAGQVSLFERTGDESAGCGVDKWEPVCLPNPGGATSKAADDSGPAPSLRAVRALHFLGDDFLLVGRGGVGFELWRRPDCDSKPPQWTRVCHEDRSQDLKPYKRFVSSPKNREPVAHRWYRRIRGVVGLADRPPDVGKTVPALLYMEPAGQMMVVRVERERESQWAIARAPLRFETGSPEPESDANPIVGAVCLGSKSDEWTILREDGQLQGWNLSNPGNVDSDGRLVMSPPHTLAKIRPPYRETKFTSLAACSGLLAVSTSGSVTAIGLPSSQGDSSSIVIRPSWHRVDGLQSIAAFSSVSSLGDVKATSPLWILSATSSSGIEWTPWAASADGDYQCSTAPRQARPSGAGTSDVLHLAIHRGADQGFETEWTLFVATRDQRLLVHSFADRDGVRARFEALVKELSGRVEFKKEELDGLNGRPGFMARRVMALVSKDFALDPSVNSGLTEQQRDWLCPTEEQNQTADLGRLPVWRIHLDASDLEELCRFLVRKVAEKAAESAVDQNCDEWGDTVASSDSEDPACKFIYNYRLWSLRLLRRASELRDDHPDLGNHLSRMLGQFALRTGQKHQALKRLIQLAAVIEKFIEHGWTYRDKDDRLLRLVDYNWDASRSLDALAYTTALLARRADRQWRAALEGPEPNSSILAMASTSDGRLSVQSHHDGRITFLDAKGTAPKLKLKDDCQWPDGLRVSGIHALIPSDNDEFAKIHHHGRHTRGLSLVSMVESHDMLLIVISKRWPSSKSPSAHVLQLHLHEGSESTLELVRAASVDVEHDAYGLEFLKGLGQREYVFAFGTRERPGADVPPFRVLVVGFPRGVKIALQNAEVVSDHDSPRGGSRGIGYDPAWKLAWLPGDEGLLFSGTLRGEVRCWQVTRCQRISVVPEFGVRSAEFVSGKGGAESEEGRREQRLDLHAPISALAVKSISGGDVSLAFGTRSGVLGLLIVKAERQGKGVCLSSAHIIHDREGSAVVGCWFLEDSLTNGEKEDTPCLLAAMESGVFTVHALAWSPFDGGNTGGRSYPCRGQQLGERICHARFALDRGTTVTRAVVVQPYRDDDSAGQRKLYKKVFGETVQMPTRILLATGLGHVTAWDLLAFNGSTRREELWAKAEALFPLNEIMAGQGPAPASPPASPPASVELKECLSHAYGYAGAMGPPFALSWMRVHDDMGMHLFRYALSRKLRDLLLNGRGDALSLEALLSSTVDEVYRHQPWGVEGAKVLWYEVARFANCLARDVLAGGKDTSSLLDQYLRAGRFADSLVNRWVGRDPRVEPRALMYSFSELFQPCDVDLLCLSPNADMKQPLKAVRTYLIDDLIRPRLSHESPLVFTEVLRSLNATIVRALRRRGGEAGEASGPQFSIHYLPNGDMFGEPEEGDPDPRDSDKTWLSLMRLVGDIAARHRPRLVVSDPFFSQVAQFFASSLLLFPDSSRTIGQVVSEAGLVPAPATAGPHDIVGRIARLVEEGAKLRTDPQPIAAAISRLRGYLACADEGGVGSGDLCGIEKGLAQQWCFLQRAVQLLAEYDPSAPQASPQEDLGGLLTPPAGKEFDLYHHSRKALTCLMKSGVGLSAQFWSPRGVDGPSVEDLLCSSGAELREMARRGELFEPQVTHFVKSIVGEWESRVKRLGFKSAPNLVLLERFERHRAQAKVEELRLDIERLRIQVGDGHPLLGLLPERAAQVGWDAKVASDLLTHSLAPAGRDLSGVKAAGATRGDDLKRVFNDLCKELGITPRLRGNWPEGEIRAPIHIWQAVLRELLTNIVRYGVDAPSTADLCYECNGCNSRAGVMLQSGTTKKLDPARVKDLQAGLDEGIGLLVGTEFGLLMCRQLAGFYGLELALTLRAEMGPILRREAEEETERAAALAVALHWSTTDGQ